MASISGSSSSLLDQLSSIPQEKQADTEIKAPSGKASFLEGTSSAWGKFKAAFFPNQVRAARTEAFNQIKNEIGEKYKGLPAFKEEVLKSFDNSFKTGKAVLAGAVIAFVKGQDEEFEKAKSLQDKLMASKITAATNVVSAAGATVLNTIDKTGSSLLAILNKVTSAISSNLTTTQDQAAVAELLKKTVDKGGR